MMKSILSVFIVIVNCVAAEAAIEIGGPYGNGVAIGRGACPSCRPSQPAPSPQQVVPYDPNTAPGFDVPVVPETPIAPVVPVESGGLGLAGLAAFAAAAAGAYVSFKGGEDVDDVDVADTEE